MISLHKELHCELKGWKTKNTNYEQSVTLMPLYPGAVEKYFLVLFLTGALNVVLEHGENTISFQKDFPKHKVNPGISEMSHQKSSLGHYFT